jgi:hypothetical protein
MGAADFIKAINAYARDYILYLVRVFSLRYSTVEEHLEDPDSAIVLHTLISLGGGVFLQQVIIARLGETGAKEISNNALLVNFTNEIAFWAFIAVVIHLMARLLGQRPHFTASLSASLRVLPPVFFMSAAASIFVASGSWLVLKPSLVDVCKPWISAVGDAVIEWVLVTLALYVGLAQATKVSAPIVPREMKVKRALITGMVVFLIVVTHLMVFDPRNLVAMVPKCLGY